MSAGNSWMPSKSNASRSASRVPEKPATTASAASNRLRASRRSRLLSALQPKTSEEEVRARQEELDASSVFQFTKDMSFENENMTLRLDDILKKEIAPGSSANKNGPRAMDGQWITSPRVYRTKQLVNARRRKQYTETVRGDAVGQHVPQPPSAKHGLSRPPSVASRESASDTSASRAAETNPFLEEVLALETGADAMAFFARHGDENPIKFVFLERPEGALTDVRLRPYDLNVVMVGPVQECDLEYPPIPFALENKDLFTMTSKGLVNVVPGEPTVFIPLEDWMRHSTIFKLLRNIGFYKHFRMSKLFSVWQKNVQFRLYVKKRRVVERSLFMAKPAFFKTAIDVSGKLQDMSERAFLATKFISSILKKLSGIQAFLNYQANNRQETRDALNIIVEETHQMIEDMCNQIVQATAEAAEEVEREAQGYYAEDQRVLPLVKQKEDHFNRLAALKLAEEEKDMLTTFVRLVDYMQCAMMASMCIDNAASLIAEMNADGGARITFETSVQFTPDGQIIFEPSEHVIKNGLHELGVHTYCAAQKVSRLCDVRLPVLRRKMRTIMNVRPSVETMVVHNKAFQKSLALVEQKVTHDFSALRDYARSFEVVRPIYDFINVWDYEAYKATANELTVVKLGIRNLREMEKTLNRMRITNKIGTIVVETRDLKAKMMPAVTSIMDEMKNLLKKMAREQCERVKTNLEAECKQLEARPVHLDKFAESCRSHRMATNNLVEHNQLTSAVDEMVRLLHQLEVKIPSSMMVEVEDMRSWQAMHGRELNDLKIYIDQNLPEQKQALDAQIIRMDEQLVHMQESFMEGEFVNANAPVGDVLKALGHVEHKLGIATEAADRYKEYQDLFGVGVAYEFETLSSCKEVFNAKFLLWNSQHVYEQSMTKWMQDPFEAVDVNDLGAQVESYFQTAHRLNKKFMDPVTEQFLDRVKLFRADVPTIIELGNPSMQIEHKRKIFTAMDVNYDEINEGGLTLEKLVEHDVFEYKQIISDMSALATGQARLVEGLHKIEETWMTFELPLQPYRNSDNKYILGDLEEFMTQMEDDQVALQTMLSSRNVSMIQKDVEEWQKRLSLLSDTIDEWIQVQRNWMYLENIFSGDDIRSQLPDEANKFISVDAEWNSTMRSVSLDPVAVRCVGPDKFGGPDKLLLTFQQSNKVLDEVQRGLEDYLQLKREAFPRFYFLSNDELLEILAQAREPRAVQPHIRKCFDCIASLKFVTDESDEDDAGGLRAILWQLTEMNSPDGEVVTWTEPVMASGSVEKWLLQVQEMMVQTLYDQTVAATASFPVDTPGSRDDWIKKGFPAQCVLLVDQITWTQGVTAALNAIENDPATRAPLEEYLAVQNTQITSMVAIVRDKIDKQTRTLVGTLLTIDVHGREVVKDLLADPSVNSVESFPWQKQLRYYWDTEINDCRVQQANASFIYGYEYLGNGFRLVVTPLTDKIYLTLTGGLQLKMGGAPAGPAGTGKTETTKDLAKALGRLCVVFNCQEGLDFVMMGQFFMGLASGGAWACFDEFNRIFIEVLSVIAQQILTIQQALIKEVSEFDFNGHIIAINQNFGVFITMNPGYAGRTELPDNLKALFRPVACMVPDYRLIAEIILLSQGFDGATLLSTKLALLYRLSSEQLSDQSHYDFGMRAVKSVLMMAGRLKMQEPDTKENILLIRALRDSNVPKFVSFDVPLFQRIISDLFPGVDVPYVDYGKLQDSIKQTLVQRTLKPVPSFVHKVIQVHETMLVRHGMMLVGECGSGKSTNIHILAEALGKLHNDGVKDVDNFFRCCDLFVLNPKSVTMEEMYGNFNGLTQEWTDGLVAKLVRDAAAAMKDNKRKWVVFDGPVDTLWIESMNTVLDDNKSLCLSNGERIKIPDSMHMVFEVQDLLQASPATVSRCGMVFMQQLHIGLKPLVEVWGDGMATLTSASLSLRYVGLLEKYLEDIIKFAEDKCTRQVRVPRSGAALHTLSMLKHMSTTHPACYDPNNAHADTLADMLFAFSITWGIGGSISAESRSSFSAFLLEILQGKEKMIGMFDSNEYSLYDVYINADTVEFLPWEKKVDVFQFDPDASFFDMFVPTSDTASMSTILDTVVQDGRNALCFGRSGVGKSALTQGHLRQLCQKLPDQFDHVIVSLSAQTNSHNMQSVLESKLEKKRKTLLGPKGMRRMTILVDDFNLPRPDLYGSQPALELLRQVIDSGGFYDKKKLFFKQVDKTMFVGTCAPPGGARNAVSDRLLRHFHVLWFTEPKASSLEAIFSSIMSGHLDTVAPEIANAQQGCVYNFVQAAITIYRRVCDKMRPTPEKSHYTFNLRDASKVVQGILMMTRKSIFNLPSGSKSDTPVDLETGFNRLFRGWLHEHMRVYADRFTDQQDLIWFCDLLRETALSNFGGDAKFMEWEDAVGSVPAEQKTASYLSGISFANLTGSDDVGEYIEYDFRTPEHVHSIGSFLQTFMDDYNTTNATSVAMDLVFFRDAVSHICRLSRILLQPRGNALLVGVGGSGRQSLTRLATYMAGAVLRQIEISRTYGPDEWREDIKKSLMMAGLGRSHVVFLLTDTQVFNETCLEDINGILSSGEVLNLYDPEDLDTIANDARANATADQARRAESNDGGGTLGRDDILAFYQRRVRERLHIVLGFSPIGSAFRKRMLQYPSFSSCCTIDWYHPWPEDALVSVAEKIIGSNMAVLGSDKLIAPVSNICMKLHASVEHMATKFAAELGRRYYVTPTSYLELLKLFMKTLETRRGVIMGKIQRYQNGVTLLQETGIKVKDLQAELIRLQPEMKQAAIDTEKLLDTLKIDRKTAEETKLSASKAETAASKLAESCESQAADCQAELDKAMPAYHKAVKALSKLDKKDISEMKTFTTPPLLVGVVMESVCLLLGKKQTWADAKKVLGDLNFLDQLKNYDKDGLTAKIIKKLEKYTSRDDFTPESVAKQSVAAMSLCMWVGAMHTYYTVAKTIEPKKAALKESNEQLATVRKELKEKQDILAAVEAKLQDLQEQYEASMKKKVDLEQQASDTKRWLQNATRLDGALGSELGRWSKVVLELKESLKWLVGNVICSSGMVSYGGAFVASYRNTLGMSWKAQCEKENVPADPLFSLDRVLGDDVTTRQWRILGLPEDSFSTENGLITTLSGRWPLLIDPQGQASRWIRNLEAENQLQTTTATDPSFLRTLENAVRNGLPVLLENVGEDLDSSLEPILLKSVFKRGGEDVMRLGEKVVPYDSRFKLYMATKLTNPHYLPETCVKVTLVNFGITIKGLEEQLLVDVVRHDRPELETRKDDLITAIAADQASLKETEDRVLNMLSEATGNILDNEELIVELEEAKVTSNVVKQRIGEAEETKKEITVAREGYRPVATRGSVLYFVIAQLAKIDGMYQYSLQFFTKLYNIRLQQVPMTDDLDLRLENLSSDVTKTFHAAVCLGLFEKDKQAYALLLAAAILKERKDMDDAEWAFFVSGGGGSVGGEDLLMPNAPWVTPYVWSSLKALETTFPSYFTGLTKHVRKNLSLWLPIATGEGVDANSTLSSRLPMPFRDSLTPFQSLLLMRAVDDTLLLPSVTEFIGEILGPSFRTPPSLELRKVLSDSLPEQPLLFLCSSGADPTNSLLQLSRDTNNNVRTVSLGQGQGPVAEGHLSAGMQGGDWVLLQNCHLSVSFLPRLEELVETKMTDAAGSLHLDFRLWLTSMPTKAFPASILQVALKMSVQPPRGIRANMLQSFASNVEQGDLDRFSGTSIDVPYRRLIFGLSFFHAMALERCKFGGLGWNKPYEWMASDLKTSIMMCGIYCEAAATMATEPEALGAVPFPALTTMIGAVTYGGRITDAQDLPTLESILSAFITPDAMQDKYAFASGGGHSYTAPSTLATLADMSSHTKAMPLFDDPNIFGLHVNANVSFQRKENGTFMQTILQADRSGSGAGGGGNAGGNNLVTTLALDILPKLTDFDAEDAGPDTFEKDDQGGINAIGVCLKNELIRFNNLTGTMRRTLKDMLKALKGLVVMSEDIENMVRSLLIQQVPAVWAYPISYLSLKPFEGWMHDYYARVQFMSNWLRETPPSSFWLSAFFFPQGFISSVKQTFARRYLVPIDQLDMHTLVTKMGRDEALQGVPPDTGVYVHGLYMNGAGFDFGTSMIRQSRPGEIYCEMPVIHLKPFNMTKGNSNTEVEDRDTYNYKCCLYKTSVRWGSLSTTGHSTNFVMPYTIQCPRSIQAQRMGVAMVLNLDL